MFRNRPVRRHSPEEKFDAESGQVYTETEIRFNRRQRSDWICEYKSPDLFKSRQVPSSHGARSLFNTALNQLVRNYRSLDPEHFAGVVPWEVADRLWEEIVTKHAESFYAWRTLARAYPHDFNGSKHRYKLDIKQPPLTPSEYFKGITSSLDTWLVCLRVSTDHLNSTDLVTIPQITNLAVLDLSEHYQFHGPEGWSRRPFDERILRTWYELALTGDAFRNLRVLMFGWQANLRDWLFKYLTPDAFPSLNHVIVTDCHHVHPLGRTKILTTLQGWQARGYKRSAKSLRPILDDKTFYRGTVSGCYYESLKTEAQRALCALPGTRKRNRPSSGNSTPNDDNEANVSAYIDAARKPILECWMGEPRPWLHILDDFPGSRTIWFDRVPLPGFNDDKESVNQPTENTIRSVPRDDSPAPVSGDREDPRPRKDWQRISDWRGKRQNAPPRTSTEAQATRRPKVPGKSVESMLGELM